MGNFIFCAVCTYEWIKQPYLRLYSVYFTYIRSSKLNQILPGNWKILSKFIRRSSRRCYFFLLPTFCQSTMLAFLKKLQNCFQNSFFFWGGGGTYCIRAKINIFQKITPKFMKLYFIWLNFYFSEVYTLDNALFINSLKMLI